MAPDVLERIIPIKHSDAFNKYWDNVFAREKTDCYGSYLTLHSQFLPKRVDIKTIMKDYTPSFDKHWDDKLTRHAIIGGKKALKCLRSFYRDKTGENLTTETLIKAVVECNNEDARKTIAAIWGG